MTMRQRGPLPQLEICVWPEREEKGHAQVGLGWGSVGSTPERRWSGGMSGKPEHCQNCEIYSGQSAPQKTRPYLSLPDKSLGSSVLALWVPFASCFFPFISSVSVSKHFELDFLGAKWKLIKSHNVFVGLVWFLVSWFYWSEVTGEKW